METTNPSTTPGMERFKEFNQTNVEHLLMFGYHPDKVYDVLKHLKQQKNYTPVGEIDRAIDLLAK